MPFKHKCCVKSKTMYSKKLIEDFYQVDKIIFKIFYYIQIIAYTVPCHGFLVW